MPQKTSHRGAAAGDLRLFAAKQLPALRAAASDLCWLLDKGYASKSATELVGNRYDLSSRQRMAVGRCACSLDEARHRLRLEVLPAETRGCELWIDGYNVLTVLESALSGGIVLLGRDNCCRDIAGIHRQYRKVQETLPALRMVGETAEEWGVARCRWWLDKPVSNSGRLKTVILQLARDAGWDMSVDLVYNPDRVLWESEQVIATSDGVVLDRCKRWVNLTRAIIAKYIPNVRLVDLSAIACDQSECSGGGLSPAASSS